MRRTVLIAVSVLPAFACALASGCGDDGRAVPGYLDPCDAIAVSPLLACPPNPASASPQRPSEQRACDKLVGCGILADEWLNNESHRLDYAWCLSRLLRDGSPRDPCAQQPYTREQVDSTVQCILALPCVALGLPLEQKLRSGNEIPDLDRYQCPSGEHRRTASVCDQGLLSY